MQPALDRRQVAAYILAGGRSRRMGRDKARLEVDGRPVVQLLAARIAPHVSAVHLVVKDAAAYADLGLPIVADRHPESALVHGIHAALTAPGPPWRWILACDMPCVDGSVLRALWDRGRNQAGSYPRWQGRDQPLPSLWRAAVAARIETAWGLTARDWLRFAGLAVWDVTATDAARLRTYNTSAEWQRCASALASATPIERSAS